MCGRVQPSRRRLSVLSARARVQVEESVMKPHIEAVRESALQQTLAYGVASSPHPPPT